MLLNNITKTKGLTMLKSTLLLLSLLPLMQSEELVSPGKEGNPFVDSCAFLACSKAGTTDTTICPKYVSSDENTIGCWGEKPQWYPIPCDASEEIDPKFTKLSVVEPVLRSIDPASYQNGIACERLKQEHKKARAEAQDRLENAKPFAPYSMLYEGYVRQKRDELKIRGHLLKELHRKDCGHGSRYRRLL